MGNVNFANFSSVFETPLLHFLRLIISSKDWLHKVYSEFIAKIYPKTKLNLAGNLLSLLQFTICDNKSCVAALLLPAECLKTN